MRPILLLALLGLMASGMTLAQTATESRVLRFPDICADTIAFVKGGDIYTVPASGGTAMHLTTHAGQELYPKFSPDCRSIAFSAEYDGTRQVYVMPTAGGEPRQLTWYNDIGRQPVRGGTDYRVLDWTVDGANVLVRANRVATDDRGGRPYLVPVAGGMETPLAVPETGGGMLSPDGKRFVYTPIDREFRSWKRYRGGRAQDVWTFDLTNNSARRLTDNPASDSQPTWVGDTIYFTSDRNHTMNLFAVSPEGGEARQLTWFTDFDVLWPSAGKDAIVFENGGAIWRFDPASAQATRVPIRVSGDSPQRLPTWKEVVGQTESFDLDASGNTLLFAARGELFRVSGNELDVRNLSQTPDARELGVDLSADGRTLAYLSDASGEYEIYLADIAGGKSRQLTRDGDVWRFAPQFSPDGKHLAYADKRQRLRIVDVDSGRTREVDSSRNDDITEYTWSPDGQWLAYTLTSDNGLTRIWLYSLKDGSRTAATEATSSAFNPVFDPKGRPVRGRNTNLRAEPVGTRALPVCRCRCRQRRRSKGQAGGRDNAEHPHGSCGHDRPRAGHERRKRQLSQSSGQRRCGVLRCRRWGSRRWCLRAAHAGTGCRQGHHPGQGLVGLSPGGGWQQGAGSRRRQVFAYRNQARSGSGQVRPRPVADEAVDRSAA